MQPRMSLASHVLGAALLAACGGKVDGESVAPSGGTAATFAQGGSGAVSQGGGNGGAALGLGGTRNGCSEPSPAGCLQNACPSSMMCDTTLGCAPSTCTCGSTGWSCTHDCQGGTCVPVTSDGSGGGAGASGCDKLVSDMQEQLQTNGTCSTVVRLDYQALTPIGYVFVCGDYTTTSEATARANAHADTGYGQGKLLSGPAPADEWVFYTSPSDFGGVSVVSARSGMPLFGGSIVWLGTGTVNYPSIWQAGDLGIGCGPTAVSLSIRGFDLRAGQELPEAELLKVTGVVLSSATARAMAGMGNITDAFVLLYPRTVGAFDPTTAEYVVILNQDAFE